jgi:gamma-aminobutyric acid type B receptor
VVAFSSQGDRIALTQIEQMINGTYFKLGYYDTQADNLTWFNMEQWSGGKVSLSYSLEHDGILLIFFLIFSKVPQDRTIVRRVLRTVSLPLFVCMSSISCCGIIVALALIVFNIWHRHRR